VVLWSEGRTEPISYFQEHCTAAGGRTAIRVELLSLADRGLILLRSKVYGGRHHIVVVPAQRLISWYRTAMASFRAMLHQSLPDLFSNPKV
jgi:hypothetical protein